MDSIDDTATLRTGVCKYCSELIYEKRGNEGLNVKTGEWQKTTPWRLWVHTSDGVVVCGFNPVRCATPLVNDREV